MAALLVIGGFICGVLACYLVMSELRDKERRGHVEQVQGMMTLLAQPARSQTNEIYEAMLQRLIDTALPAKEDEAWVEDEGRPGSPAEYEPPPPQVSDWTDPFFGMERELVGGLAPGQAIPGIGPDADISSAFNTHDDHPLANGFTPEDDDMPIGREHGDALFEEWMSQGGVVPDAE